MLRERLAAQGLSGRPAASPEAVVERLLAVQAQDLKAARLALRARSKGFTAAAVDRSLTEERSLVVSWLNRGTLHLVRSEDVDWLHDLTAPRQRTSNLRRLAEEGVSPAQAERGVGVIGRALAADGPLTRAALKERLDTARVPTQGQALVHLLFRATLELRLVRGPVIGSTQAFVLAEDWLGPRAPVDREIALAELARRYLRSHGPAREGDLAKWSGLPLGQARAGLQAIASQLTEERAGLLALRPARAKAGLTPLPPPRLLGAFDPILHGWAARDFIIPRERDLKVVTVNGIFRPTILVDGQVVGTWAMPAGEVELQPLRRLDRETRNALADEATAVQAYLGANHP